MLYKETVETETLDLIQRLMLDPGLAAFFMVGGTALSLQIGHRISIDIDLFTQNDFDSISLKKHMEEVHGMTKAKAFKNGLFGLVNGIKIDLIAHQYPLIRPILEIEEIKMASLQDIGAMKLNAILQSGSRYKDFVDIYFLLEHHPLQLLSDAYEKKYFPDSNASLAKNGLIYFNDIDYTINVKLTKEQHSKEIIQARLKDSVINASKVYRSGITSEKENQSLKQKRGRGL
jgi:hypothetical protein